MGRGGRPSLSIIVASLSPSLATVVDVLEPCTEHGMLYQHQQLQHNNNISSRGASECKRHLARILKNSSETADSAIYYATVAIIHPLSSGGMPDLNVDANKHLNNACTCR